MVPTTIILAMALPGNRLLPLSDIAYIGMWLAAWPVAFGKGNLVRAYLSTVIFTVMLLLIATAMAGAIPACHHRRLPDGSGMELVSTEDAGTI